MQEKDHTYERGNDLLDVRRYVERADSSLEVLVVLENFHDLEQSEKAIKTCELCQFQESYRDKAIAIL